jgi:serine/threonine-protein kinase
VGQQQVPQKAAMKSGKPPAKQVYAPRKNPNEPHRLVPADRRWRPSRGHWALAVIVVLALLVAAGSWWYASGRYRSMPGVVRLTQQAALDELSRDGLKASVETAYDPSIPAGAVIKSSPAAPDHVLKGGTVKLTVSLGPQPIKVPDQTGQTPDAATSALQSFGFVVQIAPDRGYSETVPDGSVVSQSPSGTAAPGTVVTLTLSKGAQQFQVPDVTGLSPGDAQAKLAAAGFTNVKVSKGLLNASTVNSQDPTGGSYARHKDLITLNTSIFG